MAKSKKLSVGRRGFLKGAAAGAVTARLRWSVDPRLSWKPRRNRPRNPQPPRFGRLPRRNESPKPA